MMEYKIRQRRLIDLVTTILKRKKAKQSGRMIWRETVKYYNIMDNFVKI